MLRSQRGLVGLGGCIGLLLQEQGLEIDLSQVHGRKAATLDDVGHRFCCVAENVITGARRRSALTPPVEPAPPRVRELWLDGAAAVHSALRARAWYFGGVPALEGCDYSWIRVDIEGQRSETPPALASPLQRGDARGDARGARAAEAAAGDARAWQLSSADVGCMFKVTVEPVRFDGERGAPTTSKPSAEVAPPALLGHGGSAAEVIFSAQRTRSSHPHPAAHGGEQQATLAPVHARR